MLATRSTRANVPRRLFALAAVAAITLAACGDDDDDDAAPAAATTEAAPAAAATTAPAATEAPATTANDRGLYGSDSGATATDAAASGGEGVVKVADSGLGQILVADNGMTLYMFMPDAQGDPTCNAACAQAWPPLTVADGATVSGGEGIDAGLLSTATHTEAGTQVTYNGWPLYFFAADSAPGDTNGQGSGGVWYVLDPTGNPIAD